MCEQAHRIVEVEWEDCAGSHGWQNEKSARNVRTWKIRSVGYVMQDDEDGLGLVEGFADISSKDGKGPAVDRGCVTVIPRSAIRKVTELQAKPKANGKRRR